jgi:hypothetical protein
MMDWNNNASDVFDNRDWSRTIDHFIRINNKGHTFLSHEGEFLRWTPTQAKNATRRQTKHVKQTNKDLNVARESYREISPILLLSARPAISEFKE